MAIKAVILFQEVTQPTAAVINPVGQIQQVGSAVISFPNIGYAARQHVAGWTESVLWNNDSVSALLTALQTGANNQPGLLPARAALLGQSSVIIGVRLYQGGAGKGQSFAFAYPGDQAAEVDNPQQALLVKVGNVNTGATRRFTLRGVPDTQISGGEFVPTMPYQNNVNNWMHALSNFYFRAIDPTVIPTPLFNVTAAGLFTTVPANQPFAQNQIVQINRVLDANGFKRSFRGICSGIGPNQNNFTIATWPFGAGTGGNAVLKTTNIFSMDYNTMGISRLVVRKVGRPFELYRGRRSRRHK